MEMKQGAIIDATLVSAPCSTKNNARERDPVMHQTKKGNQWHFGMKVHIGVDNDTGPIHSGETTPSNMHDLTRAAELVHGEKKMVYTDAGYQGIEKRPEMEGKARRFRTACAPGNEGFCQRHLKAGWMNGANEPRTISVPKLSIPSASSNSSKVMVLAALASLFLARRQLLLSS